MVARHGFRAFLKVAGAGIITKPRPGRHDILDRRRRQIVDIRPGGEKLQEIGFDRLHRRLLQHHLRKPDMVGIGTFPLCRHGWRRAPWQFAMVPVVPCEKMFRCRM